MLAKRTAVLCRRSWHPYFFRNPAAIPFLAVVTLSFLYIYFLPCLIFPVFTHGNSLFHVLFLVINIAHNEISTLVHNLDMQKFL